jgi:hypothetical protein
MEWMQWNSYNGGSGGDRGKLDYDYYSTTVADRPGSSTVNVKRLRAKVRHHPSISIHLHPSPLSISIPESSRGVACIVPCHTCGALHLSSIPIHQQKHKKISD